ncbi:MAG TPA: aquaporin, partial [Mycobacterium sp.]|nr:aquaporin [Mycobacterium sp.]
AILGAVRFAPPAVPWCVGLYITAAYWFTSSTSFANPAVTIGRMFTNTFAGIAPTSVPSFTLMQLLGAAVATGTVLVLYPSADAHADDMTLPDPVSAATSRTDLT